MWRDQKITEADSFSHSYSDYRDRHIVDCEDVQYHITAWTCGNKNSELKPSKDCRTSVAETGLNPEFKKNHL